MSEIKLYYFDVYGRAEAIRMLLHHAKVEFTDVIVTKEEVEKMKADGKLEFGQVPVIEHNGKFFSQSNAILRFLGSKHGYYPADPVESWRVDSTIDSVGDLTNAFMKAKFETDAEKQKELFTGVFTKTIPAWLAVLEKRLADNNSKEHIVGDKWTIADFVLAAIFNSFFLNEHNEQFPILNPVFKTFEHVHHYAEHLNKGLAEHLSKRSARPF